MRFLCSIAGIIWTLCAQTSLLAQEKAASTQYAGVSVPFVGCKSGGQIGPQEAPNDNPVSVPISLRAAQKLAYYSASTQGAGVLAPRGWYCFGTYGSGGEAVMVSPRPIDTNIFSTTWGGFAGPAIELSHRYGDTSGRFDVAEIIARVFPAYKAFATRVMEGAPGYPTFEFGAYPKDALAYKSRKVVEYKTPAQTDGLGTYHSSLKKNSSLIDGVAMLVGPAPDLVLLSVRLPLELNGLTSVIVQQVERDAQRSDRH